MLAILHGEQLQPRVTNQSGAVCGERQPVDHSNSRCDRAAGSGVAATVSVMQQQLDAQMALSRTLTESLTGMLEQAVTLRRILDIALHNNRMNSGVNSGSTQPTSSSVAGDGAAAGDNGSGEALEPQPKRKLSNGDDTNNLAYSCRYDQAPGKRLCTSLLDNGTSGSTRADASVAATITMGREPAAVVTYPQFNRQFGFPIPEQQPPLVPLSLHQQLYSLLHKSRLQSPFNKNVQDISGTLTSHTSGNVVMGRGANGGGSTSGSGSAGVATPESWRRAAAESSIGYQACMPPPAGTAHLPVQHVPGTFLLSGTNSNGNKHGSCNEAQKSNNLTAAAAVAMAAAEGVRTAAQSGSSGLAPVAVGATATAVDVRLCTAPQQQPAVMNIPQTKVLPQQSVLVKPQVLQMQLTHARAPLEQQQPQQQQELSDSAGRLLVPTVQPISSIHRGARHQQQGGEQQHGIHLPLLAIQQQQEQLQHELLRCQLQQQHWHQQQQQQEQLQFKLVQEQLQYMKQQQQAERAQQSELRMLRPPLHAIDASSFQLQQVHGQKDLEPQGFRDLLVWRHAEQQQQQPQKNSKVRSADPSSSANLALSALPCASGVPSLDPMMLLLPSFTASAPLPPITPLLPLMPGAFAAAAAAGSGVRLPRGISLSCAPPLSDLHQFGGCAELGAEAAAALPLPCTDCLCQCTW